MAVQDDLEKGVAAAAAKVRKLPPVATGAQTVPTIATATAPAPVTSQIKRDYAATFNPRPTSFANAQGGGASTAAAPTIATATAPAAVTPQVKRDFASYFGDAANGPARTLSAAPRATGATAANDAVAVSGTSSAVPLPPGGLYGLARTMTGMTPMAMPPKDDASSTTRPATTSATGNADSLVARPPNGASDYYSNPNSPGYNSGFAQLGRSIARSAEDAAVRANPVGPPALLEPAAPNNDLRAGVRVNPTNTDLANEGALRPASGNFSVSNPQPLIDASGKVVDSRRLSAAVQTPPAAMTGASSSNAVPGAAEPSASAADVTPTIATVTPLTAANAKPGGLSPGVFGDGDPVRSDSGRLLGYGRVVNGVRTFSDGSGGPNAVPRTMSDTDIANLAKESRLSRADAGIGGGIGSAAFRGGASLGSGSAAGNVIAGTPELGAFGGRGANTATQGGVFRMPSAASQAASDLASIIGRDTRSPLGLAMRNADVEAKGRIKPRRVETAAALAAPVIAGQQAASAMEQENLRQLSDTQRAGMEAGNRLALGAMNNQGELQRALISRPLPPTVNLADGTLGVLGPNGTVRSARDENGNVVRPQIGKTAEEIASLNKAVEDRTKTLLGIDPVSGLIPGANGAAGRAPTAQELLDATEAARASLGGGGRSAGAPQTTAAPVGVATATNPKTGKKMVLQNGKWVDA